MERKWCMQSSKEEEMSHQSSSEAAPQTGEI